MFEDEALAQQFGKRLGTNSRTGRPIYSITDRAGYNQALKDKQAAKSAGFASTTDMAINRTLRNQIEQEARGKGYTDLNSIYSEAQQAAGGGALTSNTTLQKMYEYVVNKEAFKKEEPPTIVDPPPVEEPKGGDSPVDPGPTMLDIATALGQQVGDLKTAFTDILSAQGEQMRALQESQTANMEALTNAMMQAQAMQQQRPQVAGVKMASGAAGTPMQIARRGVTGAFGRRGMRISSLNV